MSVNSNQPPKYLRYFDAILENQPMLGLPPELATCGNCGFRHERCHILNGSNEGRGKGIAAAVVIQCASCGALHLTQVFTPEFEGQPANSSVLNAIARDMRRKDTPRVSSPKKSSDGNL